MAGEERFVGWAKARCCGLLAVGKIAGAPCPPWLVQQAILPTLRNPTCPARGEVEQAAHPSQLPDADINQGVAVMKCLALAVACCALTATAAAAQAPLTKVRVAYDGFSMTSAPMIYADKQGIFRKFGLDAAPVFVEGGSTLTQAVVGGSIDIAQNGYTPAAAAAVQGADIVFIGGISNKLPFQLVVKSSITKADELKGQAIAISRYGSSTDQAADFALKHLGLTRNDVKVLQLGGPTTRIAAALSGQIAGTIEQHPDTAELSRQGFHVLVDVTDIAGD